MAVVETEAGDVNSRTVQLVKLLTEVGPDIPEISRRLGQFKESVRYRYKEKVVNKGFAVQAAVNHERLGLKRMILILELSEPYKDYAQAIFAAMSELCYVVSFARALVGGEYVVHVSAPEAQTESIREFFFALKDKGLFAELDVLDFESFRNVPMKAEYFDFDSGRWDFDWQTPGPGDFREARTLPSGRCKFDNVDLLIIKELQMDANKSLKEIAKALGINYKKLAWHHATHVCARGMLRGFRVNWMGTAYDYAMDRAMHKKHSYFAVNLFVKTTSEYETMSLRERMNRIPFLWGEAAGPNYFADVFLPTDMVVEGLEYLGNSTETVRDRMKLVVMDATDAVAFTIPYALYDSQRKDWTFAKEETLSRFDKLIVQVKTGEGR